ncbi:GNAT family N-acetyltransferase [Ramlibacter sp. WS9]|uniref:GNAT family N-acetyltransferase n=1 Tax=Ramlibacter sp. WS9 TaxID=1882741 RepID=UPI0013054477|nr:GNAT family N-acetyltransferase [Ramlibacter sp. WS9]
MVTIELLATHQDLLPTVQAWFESEWPEYYGKGGRGSAAVDLLAYSHASTLPLGLIAFRSGQACGFAALKSEPFPSHPHLGPWAGAAVVVPDLRRQGIGSQLFASLEERARALGHNRLYCATGTSASLLVRSGWRLLEHVAHKGEEIGVYDKAL